MNTRPATLRRRFALGAAGLACLIVALFACVSYVYVQRELVREIDLELAAEYQHLAESFRSADDPGTVNVHQPWMTFAALAPDGRLLHGSPVVAALLPLLPADASRPGFVAQDSSRWRVATYPVPLGRLLIAYDLHAPDQVLRQLGIAYGVGGLLAAAFAAAAGWWLSGRVVAPLARLTASAEAIRIDRLDQRVPVPATADELHRLALVLNAMLERIEQGFTQARRFSADASHELRTPLTVMRGELDRLLHSPDLPPAHEARLLRLQEAAGRLQHIVETLLLLSRLDARAEPTPTTPVDLAAVLQDVGEDAALLAEGASLRLELHLAPAAPVLGDPAQLRRLLLNLLDNAIRHNQPGGHVSCHLETTPDHAVVTLANTGPGIPPALRPHLFQRFSRGARSAHSHGLGLALACEIARFHHGSLRLLDPAPEAPGLTRFQLTLPLAPASPDRARA
ncbi:MAG: HAMP domain-containing histidine kinase [Opitutaceae bacterium]|nr:HAMP domain-containing histidine kinase [Opitutaceae bacterium]